MTNGTGQQSDQRDPDDPRLERGPVLRPVHRMSSLFNVLPWPACAPARRTAVHVPRFPSDDATAPQDIDVTVLPAAVSADAEPAHEEAPQVCDREGAGDGCGTPRGEGADSEDTDAIAHLTRFPGPRCRA